MCLGIPLKVVEINGNEAIGEMNGIKKKIRIDLIKDIKIGEFVMVHAGFALERMKHEEAEETINAILEIQRVMGQ